MRRRLALRDFRYPLSFLGVSCILVSLFSIGCTKNPVSKSDTLPPKISLSITHDTVEMGNVWQRPAVTAIDDRDGDITGSIAVSGTVNSAKIGNSFVRFSAKDRAGNSAAATCTVTVKLPASTVLYLPMDSGIDDKCGMPAAGVNHGAVFAADRFGIENQAYSFNGSSYIEFPYTAKLNVRDSFTVCAWARSSRPGSNYSADGYIIDCGYAADSGFGIRVVASIEQVVPYYHAQPSSGYATVPVLDTLWHHYAWRFNGAELSFFIDGAQYITATVTPNSIAVFPLRIGAQSKSLARYWYGEIDDILVLSSPLATTRIKTLASDGPTPVIPDSSGNDSTSSGLVTGLKAAISSPREAFP